MTANAEKPVALEAHEIVRAAIEEGSDVHNDGTIEIDENSENRAAATAENEGIDEVIIANGGQSKKGFYTKVFVGLFFLAFVVFIIVDSATNMYMVNAIRAFLEWVEDNPVGGVFAFVIVYFAATVLFLPGSILTLGAGFAFAMAFGLGGGVVLGTLAVFLGASAGAIVSFLLGRYLLREQMQKLTKKYVIFEALEAALEKNGLRIFILLRLSPIVPFNVINYIAGVTSVSLRDYVISLFAILPGTILFVFLGASAGSLTDSAASGDNSTVTIIVVVVGAFFGILAIFMTTRYARRELNRVTEERRLAADDDQGEEAGGEDQPKKESVTDPGDSARAGEFDV